MNDENANNESNSTNSVERQKHIFQLKFEKREISALLDTGANLSFLQPSVVETIKNSCKVEYIFRFSLLITPLFPNSSAVNSKFTING